MDFGNYLKFYREKYEKDQNEFEEKFSSKSSCLEWVLRIRCMDNYQCPSCGSASWETVHGKEKPYLCKSCGETVSAISETLLSTIRIPLTEWFYIINSVWTLHSLSTAEIRKRLNNSHSTAQKISDILRPLKKRFEEKYENKFDCELPSVTLTAWHKFLLSEKIK